jgi:hypothetical protein
MKINAISIAKSVFLIAFSLFILLPVASAAMVVDGSLADWGVAPGAYNGSQLQWTPGAGVSYISEDQNPAVDYLSPGWGGQRFDVEALYFKKEADIAYFAVVAGFPAAGYPGYNAGDLAIDFGSNGSFEFGVVAGAIADQGHLYGNAGWLAPTFVQSGPFELASGDDLGAVGFGYKDIGNGHYVYEFGVPVLKFGSFWTNENPDFTLHWTMSCGNDALDLRVPAVHSPEPGTYALLLMGLSSFGLLRRFRTRQQ